MTTNFKTCMFGGFDREDVIKFIEQFSKESQEKIAQLEQENASLKSGNEQMESALRTLHAQVKEQQHENSLVEELRRQIVALTERADSLQKERDMLKANADEYAYLKEHIAEIEINAHRRSEEFRAEALAQLRKCVAQQRAWCQEQRRQLALMHEEALVNLRSAEQAVIDADYAGFDEMMDSLQAIEDTLQ